MFAGGVVGTLARVGFSQLFASGDASWPWAVLAINITGAFLLGYVVTRLQERVTTGLGYNRGARVNARHIEAIAGPLRKAGFTVTVEPCWGGTPFSNVLVVGTRT